MTGPPSADHSGEDGGSAALPEPDGSLVLLRLGPAEFALPIRSVRQVLHTPPITRIPHPPRGVIGVFGLRGSIVPTLDLGLLIRNTPASRPGSVVVVREEVTGDAVGLLVDAVTGIADGARVQRHEVPPEAEASVPPGWATGIAALDAGRIAMLLDPAALLSTTSHRPAERAAGNEFAKETE